MARDRVLDRLDEFCKPVSNFWWRTEADSCRYHRDHAPTLNSTACHDGVDLPLCFEDTAILYGICAVFLIVAGFSFCCGGSRKARLPFGALHALKLILLLVPAITATCDFIFTIAKGTKEPVAQFQYVTPLVIIVSMVMSALVIHCDRLRGQRSSGLMLVFWLGLVIYGSLKLRTYILIARDQDGIEDKFRFSTFCIQYMAYLLQLILSVIPEPRIVSGYQLITAASERKPCPEEDAPFLSRITWWWQNGQIWSGWRHPIEYDDLTDLNTVDQSRLVAPDFQRNWDTELRKAGISFGSRERKETDDGDFVNDAYSVQYPASSEAPPPPRRGGEREARPAGGRSSSGPSLVIALGKSFAGTFMAAAFFKLCQDLLGFVSPQILKLMISFTKDESEPEWRGYVYAVVLFLTAVVQSLFLHQYFHRCFTIGMRMRTAIIAAVYNKALRLSNKARRTSTVGEIVNLMSVDAQRLMDLMSYIHTIWSAPLQIVLSLVFLYLTMGPSIFAGFAVMILMIPVNAAIATWNRKLQVKQMILKDSRIKLVNELLNGIKVIKLYAWEIPFQRLVFGIRQQELDQLKKNALLNATASITWTCAPFLVSLATFATYSLVNLHNPEEQLTADKAFVALSLFNILRFPLSMLPMLISSMVQASVSVKRLRNFLKNEELDPNIVDWSLQPPASDSGAPVVVNGGQFSWGDEAQQRPTLSNVNLHVKPGQLVAVVGQVGAGKSSLIQALLGEMEKHGGNVSLKGSVAYVPQQAWIQNATLKENILFGKELNNMRYGKTLEACALVPDLDILPGRDMVEIGEKGINLSGGQKQRVSLARAVYQDSDIYLLDDPLSAVDSHVGKHIFDKVLGPQGMLKNKVRLLVTHGIGFLPQCDIIVVMADGQITEVGSYNELIENDGDFAHFLQTYQNVEANEDENGPSDNIELQRQSSQSGVQLKKQLSRKSSESEIQIKRQVSRQLSKASLHRQQSIQSIGSSPEEFEEPTESTALISEEKTETGKVKLSVILAYCRACNWILTILTLFFYISTSGSSVASNFWLADWSNAEGNYLIDNATYQATACDKENGPDVGCYLGVYSALGVAQALLVFFAVFALAIAAIFASRKLHAKMLKNILRSPMSFFDTTPLGRVLNRFSKDIYVIDEVLPQSARAFLFTFFNVLSSLVVIIVTTPIFVVAIIPLGIFYFLVQRFYVATSRQLKRLESVTRSPIYSHFQESIMGASSIRAYRQQDRFMKESERRVDNNQIAYYPNICANRWLAIRLEFVGNLIIFFAALFAVIQRNYGDELHLKINPGLVGLSISYALQITQSLNYVVRMASELETNIVAVERIKEYSETPTEASPIIESNRPSDDWPSQGHVKFEHYSTRYREGLDLVLKDITVDIPGGTKVGIVGRTGAGKSSLTVSMFRIIEAAGGAILIDNNNIAHYGLDDLRSKITIIPQDPVLFSGTLRMNLDPFESYSDGDLWRALESAHLKTFVSGLEKELQHEVAEGGENLSVGQRQLVCLARALLRKTKILVLDEATAAVDLETDDLIQKTIRSEFRDCTIITIAHRLNTIMDYDRIVVLDKGRVKEYDTPSHLLADKKSVFFSMASDAGITS